MTVNVSSEAFALTLVAGACQLPSPSSNAFCCCAEGAGTNPPAPAALLVAPIKSVMPRFAGVRLTLPVLYVLSASPLTPLTEAPGVTAAHSPLETVNTLPLSLVVTVGNSSTLLKVKVLDAKLSVNPVPAAILIFASRTITLHPAVLSNL